MTSLSLSIFQSRLPLNRVYRRLIAGGVHKVFFEKAPLLGPAPYPFILYYMTFLDRRGIPSLDKLYTFHMPSCEICFPLTTVNSLYFEYK